jgi:hypothetical protein
MKTASRATLIWALGLLAGGPRTSGLTAQAAFTPGVAWGANAFPFEDKTREAFSVQFDLFTELAKDTDLRDTGKPRLRFRRYNDIERTLGFNQIGHSWIWVAPPGSSILGTTYRRHIWAAVGWEFDTITEWLQNDFAHGIRDYAYVPRDTSDVKGGFRGIVGGGSEHSFVGSFKRRWPWTCCEIEANPEATLGLTASSIYGDEYGSLGVNFTFRNNRSEGTSTPAIEWLQIGALVRAGWVPWSGFELSCGLINHYTMMQTWATLPSGDWAAQEWFPKIRITYSFHAGPFAAPRGPDYPYADAGGLDCSEPADLDPMKERLLSLRFERKSWVIETWNDVGAKDMGPTFGLRLIVYHDPWPWPWNEPKQKASEGAGQAPLDEKTR